MEREVYTSDFTGAAIEGARYLMEIRRVTEDGKIHEGFGVRVYDLAEGDIINLGLDQKGRRLSVRGRRSKETDRV